MKITQEKLPASQIGLEIEITPELSQKTYDKVVKEFASSANIPGFRKGKVPRTILLQRLGSQRIKGAVLEELIQESLQTAIKQESIDALGNYQLRSQFEELVEQYKPGEALIFKAAVDVPPEVELGQYQDLTVKAEELVYESKQVDDLLKEHQNRRATVVPIEDRPAQTGDLAFIDFQGRKPATNDQEEGELIEGAQGTDFQVELSEGKFIPGFVEGIVGMNIDETKTLNLSFPEDYPQKELAGQAVIFTITLKELKEKELPELDDDFAQEISEFETMAELRESLEKQYQEKAANETKSNIHAAIAEELLKHTSVELPVSMIEEEVQNLLVQTASQLQNYGMDIRQVFTREMIPQMRERSRPEAIKNLQKMLIVKEIAKKEAIEVESEALKERITQVKATLQEKDIDEAKLEKIVSEELLTDKVLSWLQDKTQVELVPEGSLQKSEETEEKEEETTSTVTDQE
jgi:trigger factor